MTEIHDVGISEWRASTKDEGTSEWRANATDVGTSEWRANTRVISLQSLQGIRVNQHH